MWHYFAKTYLQIYKIQVPYYCIVVTLTTMKYLISWILANLGAVEGDFWKQSNKFSRWGLLSHHNSSMKSFRAAFSSTCFPHSVQQSMQFDYWHIWKYARFSESFNLKYLKWLLALKRFHLRQMDLNKWKYFFATARITVQYGKPRFLQRPQAPRQDIICRLSTTLHLSMNWYKPLHEMFVSKSL